MSTFIIVEAFEKIRCDVEEEYLSKSRNIDALVKANEPKMIVHVQSKVAFDDSSVTYRWLEVYPDWNAVLTHLGATHTQEHMKAVELLSCGKIELRITGSLPEEASKMLEALSPRLFEISAGFVRE